MNQRQGDRQPADVVLATQRVLAVSTKKTDYIIESSVRYTPITGGVVVDYNLVKQEKDVDAKTN